jgi:anti-sigma factor RsiW
MIDKAGQKRLMVQYLFGELSAEDRAQFEDAYLQDSDVFQELVATESEIIDKYILGELSEEERQQVERSLRADPGRRERVETARSLLLYSAAAESALTPRPFAPEATRWRGGRIVQAAGAAVVFILLGGISWLFLSNRRMSSELQMLRRERSVEAQTRQALQKELDGLRSDLLQRDTIDQQMSQLPGGTAAFDLAPVVTREPTDQLPTLVIPAGVTNILFRVLVESGFHASCAVSLRTADGTRIWRRSLAQGDPAFHPNQLVITVPARVLENGDYVLRVSSGGEDALHTLAGYGFHVITHANRQNSDR